MSQEHADPAFVARQYRSADNLAARQRIYQFAATKTSWHAWVFDQMRLPPDARVLELGCGNGMLWRENIDRIPPGWDVTLSDLSAGMLSDARAGLAHHVKRFRFARVDAQAIPFPKRTFDAVVANHMLYHVPERPRAYAEIARVLKPGGQLFAATNGDGHVIAIRNLIAHFVPLRGNGGCGGFSLGGARDELAPRFAPVDVLHLRGELRVPDAGPVLGYVNSMDLPEPLSQDQLGEIERTVRRQIEREGTFRISTETGLCRARMNT